MSPFGAGLAATASPWLTATGVVLIVTGATLLVLVDVPRRAVRRIARLLARRPVGPDHRSRPMAATGAVAFPPPLERRRTSARAERRLRGR